VADCFETTAQERWALFTPANAAKAWLDREYQPDGFNLGVNVGAAAGQGIFHVHLHLIPRYRGDVAAPRGGVRGVVASQQSN
jgi:diadenosine tetraphosphate (Ap4A) HIT family hydrolase